MTIGPDRTESLDGEMLYVSSAETWTLTAQLDQKVHGERIKSFELLDGK